ncbi:MAG: hypothetical protein R3B07_20585 [Polyangiaceae bacterium]
MAMFASYWGFMGGAIVLALGTAVFKPGIQGTLVNSTRPENSSMAWGIFYQTVNIGGFLGPLVAAYMRGQFRLAAGTLLRAWESSAATSCCSSPTRSRTRKIAWLAPSW